MITARTPNIASHRSILSLVLRYSFYYARQRRWRRDMTNLMVTRSSTTGAIFPKTGASAREGINVQFGGVTCGPYSTRYDILWTTATAGATPTRSASAETFDAPLPVDLDKVPNGAVGEVTVTASCPTSTKPSTATFPYTQPLPTPVLTATAGTPPNVHTLSWAAVTSLTALYSTELSRDGGAFAVNGTASPNPTTATSETVAYPLGSTYGVSMAYQVTAAVGPTRSSPSMRVIVSTDWPFIVPPALKPSSTGLLLTVTSDPALCPAGTSPEYSQTRNLNQADTEPPSPWSADPVVQYILGEGDQADIAGNARCVYNAAQDSPGSTPVTITFIQPITTMPNPPTAKVVDAPNAGDPVSGTYPILPVSGCPAGTTVEFSTRTNTNGLGFTARSPWSSASSAPISGVRYGDRVVLEARGRCVSPYAQGPSGLTSSTTFDRPIPAPAAPVAGHDSGGPSTIEDDRFTYTAVTCPAGTTATYLRDWFVTGVGAGNDPTWVKTLNLDVGTDWGFDYNYTVAARCESPYVASGPSPAASTSWSTPIPAPNGTPALSLSTNSAPVNTNFNVNLSSATCKPALQLLWSVTPNGGQVSGSFTTHHTTTGFRTYQASAYCHSPYTGRDGPSAAAPARGINITAPPAPAAPSGLFASAKWYKFCGNIGFTGSIGWSSVAGATSYSVQADWAQTNGLRSGWTNEGTTTGNSLDVLQFSSVANSPNVLARVKAVGPGGSSAWTQFTVPLQPACG